jgi:hypothetical protein
MSIPTRGTFKERLAANGGGDSFDGAHEERVFVAWADQWRSLAGFPQLGDAYPGTTNIVCVQRDWKPISEQIDISAGSRLDTGAKYKIVEVTCLYSTEGWGEYNDEEGDTGVEGLDVTPQGYPVSISLPVTVKNRNFTRLVSANNYSLSTSVWDAATDCVNDTTWKGGAAGHWLYCGYSDSLVWRSTGGVYTQWFRVRHHFKWRKLAHNLVFDPTSGAWVTPPNTLYPPTSFSVFGL